MCIALFEKCNANYKFSKFEFINGEREYTAFKDKCRKITGDMEGEVKTALFWEFSYNKAEWRTLCNLVEATDYSAKAR